MRNIPRASHIRSLLDPVSPKYLNPMYRLVFERLETAGVLGTFRSHARSYLVAMNGTEYFSSQKIRCPNCSHRELSNGQTNYYHSVITPVIVQADNEHVISLEPEFIVPQNGHEKQDCEIEAGKRWLRMHGEYYAKRNITILGDDLYSRQPFCEAVTDAQMHFILSAKKIRTRIYTKVWHFWMDRTSWADIKSGAGTAHTGKSTPIATPIIYPCAATRTPCRSIGLN